MARPIPFYFCRYSLLVGEELLDTRGQLQALKELQGQFFAHGPKAERESHLDSVVMRPREFQVRRERILAWSVGRKIGVRHSADYDPRRDRLIVEVIEDGSYQYSDFIAVPRLGVLAVDDRSGPLHLGGKAAISRFRSIFRNLEDGAVNIELTTTPEDVKRALRRWELTEFSFVVRPYNPHPPGDLSEALSEQFKKDGIGRYRAKAQPFKGKRMKPAADGHIASAVELADAGYGQYAFKGVTEDGHVAQVKQPPFEDERRKNQERQNEPRELRVLIDPGGTDDAATFASVADALIGFYDGR